MKYKSSHPISVMRKFLLVFFLSLGTIYALRAAENSIQVLLPDSINELYNRYKQDPTHNLQAFFTYVEYLQNNEKQYDYVSLMEELQHIATSSKDSYYKAYAYYLMGAYYLKFNVPENASNSLNLALNETRSAENNTFAKKLKIKIHLAIGAYFFHLGNWDKALLANNEAQKLNLILNDSLYRVYINNNLAVIYKNLGENDKAIELFLKNSSFGNMYPLSMSNIADSYLNLHMPDSAMIYLKRALAFNGNFHPNYSIANTYYLIGHTFEYFDRIDSAVFYFNKALSLSDQYHEESVKMQILLRMTQMFKEHQRLDEALHYCKEMILLSEKNQNLMVHTLGLKAQSDILDQMDRKDESYEILKHYLVLNDSLRIHETTLKARQNILQNRFELEQQKLEFDFKENRMKMQHTLTMHRYMSITLVLALVLGIAIILIYLKKKNIELKNKNLQETALIEKLELKNKELINSVMFRMNKDEIIKKIIPELQELRLTQTESGKKKIDILIRTLQHSLHVDILSEFEYSFLQIHQHFYENLLKDFPNLTLSERRLCAFIKLNLTTKEIATIMSLDPNSIRVARVRLRKKLGLTNNDLPLYKFLSKY